MNMRNIVVLFSLLLHCPIAWGTAYHVAQQYSNASDGNRGTADSPWKTLSKAAEILEPGDTVVVHSGVYREQVEPGRSGTREMPITYRAAEGEEVIITGADIIRGWTPAKGTIWKKQVWPYRFRTHPNDERHRLIGRCEQVIVDGELLKQVAKLDDMAAGTFCADAKGKVVLKGGTTKERHLQCVRSSSAHSGGILCVFDSLP
ncbi:hypothetical protein HQ563_11315 [bacterium]|nr:hypothetical protein [bacterium]